MIAFKVPGMTCGGCAASVRRALGAVAGVEDVRIDLDSKDVRVDGTPSADALRTALDKAGFEAEGLPAA
ncbi:heavy-metal-associated domain-containing protein (plasmid) [Azospirillum brasilense]|uniref:Heavy-metal-associated domain-containing protein n=1 Tax=Azospirillum brasilense TaxID=192 RepID=A0A4D8R1J8_AZOBR|nr:heavy metal-associated domain-containing protein [Azospirillum brasilense]QCO17265.1 heavy-metal-associated domain-containing protein [Azospirillum brasilense]